MQLQQSGNEEKTRLEVEDVPQEVSKGLAEGRIGHSGWPYYKYFMLIDIRAHGSVSCTLSYDSTQCSTYRLRSFVERPRTAKPVESLPRSLVPSFVSRSTSPPTLPPPPDDLLAELEPSIANRFAKLKIAELEADTFRG